MRSIVTLFVLALLLAACSGSHEETMKEHPTARLYLAMNDDVNYAEQSFSGDLAAGVVEIVRAECPSVEDEFLRATLETETTVLTLYASADGKNVSCATLKNKKEGQVILKTAADAPSPNTALLVNGEPITLEQIRLALGPSPDLNQTELVINTLINSKLLEQEAAKVRVAADDVAAARKQLLAQLSVEQADLSSLLAAKNLTQSDFDVAVEEQARLHKLFEARLLLAETNVSEAEARQYYSENPNQFVMQEQAAAGFLLISSTGRTLEEGLARAQEIAARINTTDFCDLVQEYSDDEQAKEKCGRYVLQRGVINPDLERAAFAPPGQIAVVSTEAGIYFVQPMQTAPAQIAPFSQVAAQVQSGLQNIVVQSRLELYVSLLRSQAEIVSFLG